MSFLEHLKQNYNLAELSPEFEEDFNYFLLLTNKILQHTCGTSWVLLGDHPDIMHGYSVDLVMSRHTGKYDIHVKHLKEVRL